MKEKDQKSINNLTLRYQNYDNEGVVYSYDILYTTIHSAGTSVKCRKQTGADAFRKHIAELCENFEGVSTITVQDYNGKSRSSKPMNAPVTIELLDVTHIEAPRVVVQSSASAPPSGGYVESLKDTMAKIGAVMYPELQGLGDLAVPVGIMDSKHTINTLTDKNNELQSRNLELVEKAKSLEERLAGMNDKYEQLQDENADLEDELEEYHERDRKQNSITALAGAVVARGAKMFIQKHPSILSGLLPAEALAGILNDEEPEPEPIPVVNGLTPDQQEQMDKSTAVFDWLQSLDRDTFMRVANVIGIMQENPESVTPILQYCSRLNRNIHVSENG
ncbi:hypothetical protein FACS189464_1770 [Bacteroidia bacterium]|nr:hypothetical protein FACS189464_1770 [Bacteroidia bacterium]